MKSRRPSREGKEEPKAQLATISQRSGGEAASSPVEILLEGVEDILANLALSPHLHDSFTARKFP